MSEAATPPSPGISRTSIYVAAGRAVGAREPDPAARNPDYLAEKLLGDPSAIEIDHPAVRALSLGYDEAMQSPERMREQQRVMAYQLAEAVVAGPR